MEIEETVSLHNGIDDKEKALLDILKACDWTIEGLNQLLISPVISRHLSLVHIVQQRIQDIEFDTSQKRAGKESVIKKLLLGISFGP